MTLTPLNERLLQTSQMFPRSHYHLQCFLLLRTTTVIVYFQRKMLMMVKNLIFIALKKPQSSENGKEKRPKCKWDFHIDFFFLINQKLPLLCITVVPNPTSWLCSASVEMKHPSRRYKFQFKCTQVRNVRWSWGRIR